MKTTKKICKWININTEEIRHNWPGLKINQSTNSTARSTTIKLLLLNVKVLLHDLCWLPFAYDVEAF